MIARLEEHVSLAPLTSIRIGGEARYFIRIEDTEDIPEAIALLKEQSVETLILGGGSNTIFRDGVLPYGVLHVALKGFEVIAETSTDIDIKIGAGESWDSVVRRSVERGLSGIEVLSAIPGTAGATPVQNVGAYGGEISEVFVSLEAFDMQEGKHVVLSKEDCAFSYRSSIFRTTHAGRYIITSVTLRLSKLPPALPTYDSLVRYLEEEGIEVPTVRDIRKAVIGIRSRKLPDPSIIPNAGSFFKNPVVSAARYAELLMSHPDMPAHTLADGSVKLYAGWMIEGAVGRGMRVGKLETYPHNALVLVNRNGASFSDLLEAREIIINAVEEAFGVLLEQEPLILPLKQDI